MCFEVAEHLPPSHAKDLIHTLTSLSDVILFSAAIEGQGGTHHINEQMPEYWCELFINHGYVPVDYLRPKIWGNTKVTCWYQQNLLFYVKQERLQEFPQLYEAYRNTHPHYLLRIHPFIYRIKLHHIQQTSSFVGFLRWKLSPLKQKYKKLVNRMKKEEDT